VALREPGNRTNERSLALSEALQDTCKVTLGLRSEDTRKYDLVVQTGFASTLALNSAIDHGIPYIIMEAPLYREGIDIMEVSSWGYNGLAGGAWRPDPPEQERPKPTLKPMKTEGDTLIIGQKPTDHSLRGSDHVRWLLDKFREHWDARFRPHPLMVPSGSLPPLMDDLQGCRQVITYTSTVGADALVEGCISNPEGYGSSAYQVRDREMWIHGLSWAQAEHRSFGELREYILGGYEQGRVRAHKGLQERPRERIDGAAIQQRYNRLIVR